MFAAIAVALKQCRSAEFAQYAGQVVANAQALAAALVQKGYHMVTGNVFIQSLNRISCHILVTCLCIFVYVLYRGYGQPPVPVGPAPERFGRGACGNCAGFGQNCHQQKHMSGWVI